MLRSSMSNLLPQPGSQGVGIGLGMTIGGTGGNAQLPPPPRTPRIVRESIIPPPQTPARLLQPQGYTSDTVVVSSTPAHLSKEIALIDMKPICSAFTQSFDSWALLKRKSLADSRSVFLNEIKDLVARKKELENLLESYKASEADIQQTFGRQRKEQELMEEEISQIAQARKARTEELDILNLKTSALTREIQEKRQALQLRASTRKNEKDDLMPLISMYERLLAMKMVTTKAGVIRFVFTHINELKLDQEYSFEICVSSDTAYSLISCKPMIPEIDAWLEWLNSSRELFGFVKNMRAAFVKYTRTQTRHMT
ncbi:hypothetical protein BASA50_000712 [Batrachochytrium salamandrivorans]|uniref:Kinetochore protein SPC25 n=1 Tax=Batrachochytrium salamandrivorans TaxID=1357716 RepID=A0ABQ8ETI7_9FUNG|nr:hypothetical protein BASA60_004819 [Batrachochytrium salamandrivorans]KAH6576794.1 hypothetical protein BASA62_001245 [Batrachochytrium salamandrivorans]KAH6585212.1 hypothetical protein BASA61_007005 [Batrachochytrium salamandrivorans]KAH6586248.1 hypothetical protein BASA50_000712 [Batrachochytrium salamandrivorans]KAH9254946.1 hypothetical protein BASA81_007013 [Batrachochytrium salamandrivorans]